MWSAPVAGSVTVDGGGSSVDDVYLVQSWDPANKKLRVYRITGTASPLLQVVGDVLIHLLYPR